MPTNTEPKHAAVVTRGRRPNIGRRALLVAAGAVAVAGLAACGSSASKATVTPGAAGSRAKVDVGVGATAKVGSVLVDRTGMTLYTLTSNGSPVPCTGTCAKAWPPLVLSAGETAPVAATGVTGIATKTGSDGAQVTDNGDPLYRFSGDKAPGDANGSGRASFGGVWNTVAAPAGAGTPTAPATTPGTTASSGGNGY